jgi:ABC-2 type transport system ATP-binding protein
LSECIFTRELTKKYGEVEALRGLNLAVESGVFGLVGPNGSGKTTFIKILVGAAKADSGESKVFGFDCWNESFEVRQRAGVLHERASFPREATGFDLMVFVGRLRGLSKIEAKTTATQLLDWIGLGNDSSREIKGYSAGMKQKLNFVQALVGRPQLVILDEPTAHLDPFARIQLLEKIRELHKEYGMSFLISSHILPELEEICAQVGIIYHGTVIEQGRLEDLAQKYFANTFEIVATDTHFPFNKIKDLTIVKEARMVNNTLIVRVSDPKEFYDIIMRLTGKGFSELRITQRTGDRLKEIYKAILHTSEE